MSLFQIQILIEVSILLIIFSINLAFITESWDDYQNFCSPSKFIKDPEHTEVLCHTRYRYSDVSWRGYVIRVDYDDYFFAKHRASLLIKMLKNNDNEEPDLYLKFPDYHYNHHKHSILNITRGDYVAFNATIMFEGNAKSTPMLEAFGFEVLNEHIFIQPHIHHSGRYSVSNEGTIHKDDSIYKEIPGLVSDEEIVVDQHETNH
jgi:hypothetical protein